MRTCAFALLLTACMQLASSGAAAAERVKLTVDMGGVKSEAPYPVRSGIPFARGKLVSADNVRLLAGNGEIEVQTRVLATWPDRSVKWLLLDFFAKDGEEPTIEYGADVKRKAVAGGIRASAAAGSVTLDNGAIRLTVNKPGCGFIDELAFDKDGNGKYDEGDAVVRPPAAGEQRYFLDFVHRPPDASYATMGNCMPGGIAGRSQAEVTDLAMEDEGPLHCVVRIRGQHKVASLASRIAGKIKGAGRSDFTMRLHLWKGLPAVTGEAHFVFDGVGDDDFVQAWGVRFDAAPGMKLTTIGRDGAIALAPQAAAPFAALTQSGPDAFSLWTADKDRMGETIVADGKRSCGWADLSDDRWGVAVGTRWFWQRWPNAIHYDSVSGGVSVMLFPPEAGPMDLRRYARSEWGVGETSAPEGDLDDYAPFASRGTGNTKEFCLLFHRGRADLTETGRRFQAFGVRPVAKAAPSHYSQTRALGYYAPRAAGQFDDFEKKAQEDYAGYVQAQEKWRWYGMWDYGDYQQRFGTPKTDGHGHERWENDWGRWGWGHGDGHGRVDRSLLIEYLRTGERLYFDQGEAHVRHRIDADIIQSREVPWDYSVTRKIPPDRTKGPWWDLRGCSHRHAVQHWSEAYVGARGGNPLGPRIYYYLTGDGRTADMLDVAAEMGMTRYGWGGYAKVAQRLGHSGGNDGLGVALQGILIAWERTGDGKYRDAIKAAIGKGSEVYDLLHPKGSWNVGMTTAFGAFQAVEEYGDLTGDSEAKAIILDAAEQIKTMKRDWMWPGSFHPVVAAAYRMSGDAALEKLAREMIADQVKKETGFNSSADIPFQIEALNLRAGK